MMATALRRFVFTGTLNIASIFPVGPLMKIACSPDFFGSNDASLVVLVMGISVLVMSEIVAMAIRAVKTVW